MLGLLELVRPGVAIAIHLALAPVVFALVAWSYFRARGARDALPTALGWIAMALALDIGVAFARHDLAMLGSLTGTWLPLGLGLLAAWAIGGVVSTMPWPKAPPVERRRA